MKESYCGVCDTCPLGTPGFQEAIAQVQEGLARMPKNLWVHCFPGDAGFSLPEFLLGLEWFKSHTQCAGCAGGKGLQRCIIRNCAIQRGLEHCFECQELKDCRKFNFLKGDFPDLHARLRRRQLKHQTKKYGTLAS